MVTTIHHPTAGGLKMYGVNITADKCPSTIWPCSTPQAPTQTLRPLQGTTNGGDDSVDHPEMVRSLRRSSSGHILDVTDGNQVLGTLHSTIRYSFDKNALVVTVNRCEHLPAKDSAAKSRYLLLMMPGRDP